MNPTGLPELFKPTRDKNQRQICEKKRFTFFKNLPKIKKVKTTYFPIIPY